jgi:hypothetical protein
MAAGYIPYMQSDKGLVPRPEDSQLYLILKKHGQSLILTVVKRSCDSHT